MQHVNNKTEIKSNKPNFKFTKWIFLFLEIFENPTELLKKIIMFFKIKTIAITNIQNAFQHAEPDKDMNIHVN